MLWAKVAYKDENHKLGLIDNIIAGSVAGGLEAAVVVQPFERGKTLRADFASPAEVYSNAYKSGGIMNALRTIYVGFVPTLGRQVGNQATSFSLFYWLKDFWCAQRYDSSD